MTPKVAVFGILRFSPDRGKTRVATKRPGRAREPVPIEFPPTGELAEAYQRWVAIALRLPGVEETRSSAPGPASSPR